MKRLSTLMILAVFVSSLPSARTAHASTAAFAGDVIEVQDCRRNCLKKFTVKIRYFDYVSWSKFNRDSKTGETITRQVNPVGTACVINGRLTNAATFAAAIKPGQWGYFYEDTWLDLYTTPDFQWGEVVSHDAAKKSIQLRVHRTHKEIHLDANPPQTITINYDRGTAFQIENKKATAAEAVKPGRWLQVHQPRRQLVLLRDKSAEFKPSELLPVEEGRRGFANRLTTRAVLRGFQSERPTDVIDIPVQIEAHVQRDDTWTEKPVEARKVTFILDGKPCPVNIGAAAGRQAVLCYYRKEKKPHKVFVRSRDNAVRGRVKSVFKGGRSLVITAPVQGGKSSETKVELAPDARFWLNGQATDTKALSSGLDIEVHPARGTTIRAFVPQEQNED